LSKLPQNDTALKYSICDATIYVSSSFRGLPLPLSTISGACSRNILQYPLILFDVRKFVVFSYGTTRYDISAVLGGRLAELGCDELDIKFMKVMRGCKKRGRGFATT
ncbi:hypothetical protein CEXT_724531, partial [Caerostris extrusa]